MSISSKDLTGGGVPEYLKMGVTEGINYVLFSNPISSVVVRTVKGIANSTLFQNPSTTAPIVKLPPALENLPVNKLVYSGNPFLRMAALSGAAAVVLGAFGAHSFYVKEGNEERKKIFQIANTYHFIHSLALFGVPLCRFSKTAGSLLMLGMTLFCGTCYYDAFIGNTELRKFTPVGGTCLIFGWICLAL